MGCAGIIAIAASGEYELTEDAKRLTPQTHAQQRPDSQARHATERSSSLTLPEDHRRHMLRRPNIRRNSPADAKRRHARRSRPHTTPECRYARFIDTTFRYHLL